MATVHPDAFSYGTNVNTMEFPQDVLKEAKEALKGLLPAKAHSIYEAHSIYDDQFRHWMKRRNIFVVCDNNLTNNMADWVPANGKVPENIVLVIASTILTSCAAQGLLSGVVRVAANLLEPIVNVNNGQDGYRFRYATEEQVREEKGSFENGVWTVRGVVEWLSPDRKTKHRETYMADDKGYKTIPEDEPFGRAGLSPGALASLAG